MSKIYESGELSFVYVDKSSKKRNLSFSSNSPSPQSLKKDRKYFKKMSEGNEAEMSEVEEHVSGNENSSDTKKKLPEYWAQLSQNEKLDKMMEKMLQLDDVTTNVNLLVDENNSQKDENTKLKLKVAALEGKNIRLENELTQIKMKVEDLQWRGMRNNILFYNIEENDDENCETLVIDFLKSELCISGNLIYSESNLGGEVRIDVAHRMGISRPSNTNPRPIVASFLTRKGKELVMSQAPKLKGKDVSISEQLPSEMRERRLAQIDTLNELRSNFKNKKTHNIRLVKDKLYMNRDVVKPAFKYNPLPNITESPIAYEELSHGDELRVSGSVFQGHAYTINNTEEATKARCALMQNPGVAQAHHIMYAYKFDGPHGVVTGNDDDGEHSGSKYLTELLDNPAVNNMFLAVSRVHNGPNLGRQRFELIQAAAERALNLVGLE